jgi:hypothetical protein
MSRGDDCDAGRAWVRPQCGVKFSFLQIIKHRVVTKNLTAFSVMGSRHRKRTMSWKTSAAAPFLLVLLFLTSCVIPIPIGLFIKDIREEDPAHYAARLEPPARYDHPYKGHVVERVVPAAEVPSLCMPTGADPFGAACSLESNGTCYIVLPSDGRAPVSTFRRHEIAHCNGWPANHPHDG